MQDSIDNKLSKFVNSMTALVFLLMLLTIPSFVSAETGVQITETKWESGDHILVVKGKSSIRGGKITIKDFSSGEKIGETSVDRERKWRMKLKNPKMIPCAVIAEIGRYKDTSLVKEAPRCDLNENDINPGDDVQLPENETPQAMHLYIMNAEWNSKALELVIGGSSSMPGQTMRIRNLKTGISIASASVLQDGSWNIHIINPTPVPCVVAASAQGLTSSKDVVNAPGNCDETAAPPSDNGELKGSHEGRFSSYEGSSTCMECHYTETLDMHGSVHYQWKGNSEKTIGLGPEPSGKLGGINDFCIYPDINWIGKMTNLDGVEVDGGCAKCHVGMGEKPSFTESPEQLANIDCLVCHSEDYRRKVEMVDGRYAFVPDTEKMSVGVLEAAVNIIEPSNDNCLNCHTKSGGGNNYKRGDIEEAHRNPTKDFDVHMASTADGGAGLKCIDCHSTTAHRVEGRGTDLRPMDSENELNCNKCHSERPHDSSSLNKHTARVNCTVCHIPVFAKGAPTDMERNWSLPGEVDEAKRLYDPHNIKESNVMPEYKFFNGMSHFYKFGDPAVPGENGRIIMSAPDGTIQDQGAKIHAFKHHLGTQPIDPVNGKLLPLKIGIFFQTGDLDTAVKVGTEAVGWDYNGHDFADTERYMGLFHEVAPKEQALTCTNCHDGGDRLDFDALGYERKATYNNRPLCASCHGDESDEWRGSELFGKVHKKHVDDKKLDCSACHKFSSAN